MLSASTSTTRKRPPVRNALFELAAAAGAAATFRSVCFVVRFAFATTRPVVVFVRALGFAALVLGRVT
jgi:hypothetical protein